MKLISFKKQGLGSSWGQRLIQAIEFPHIPLSDLTRLKALELDSLRRSHQLQTYFHCALGAAAALVGGLLASLSPDIASMSPERLGALHALSLMAPWSLAHFCLQKSSLHHQIARRLAPLSEGRVAARQEALFLTRAIPGARRLAADPLCERQSSLRSFDLELMRQAKKEIELKRLERDFQRLEGRRSPSLVNAQKKP